MEMIITGEVGTMSFREATSYVEVGRRRGRTGTYPIENTSLEVTRGQYQRR